MAINIDSAGELNGQTAFTRPKVTLLPDPEPRPRIFPVISVDDHLVEPPDIFEGRMPKKYKELGPRIIELDNGDQVWKMGDEIIPEIALNNEVGKPLDNPILEPTRFDEMRVGGWDIDARIKEMDIDGVWASLCFPSTLSGFAGWRYSKLADKEFGLAALQAWNDWHIEVWAGRHPERIIPCQIPWLNDAEIAADEVRKNASRGFKAVTFPQMPHQIGFPSMHSGYWDPFFRACEETETVICLHLGTSGSLIEGQFAPDTPVAQDGKTRDAKTLLVELVSGAYAVAEWLFSKTPVRFPNIKIALSECGIGWVPFIIDRLDYLEPRRHWRKTWINTGISGSDCLRRNFWFCALGEHNGFQMRHAVGIDHILVESDYPHGDTTWPDTQSDLARAMEGIPADEIELMTYKNAAKLFRHDLTGLNEWMKEQGSHT